MVRQRKSHPRVKRGPAAQAEVLSGDGQPDEGETGEGTSGAWEEGGDPSTWAVPVSPGCEFTSSARWVEGLIGRGRSS